MIFLISFILLIVFTFMCNLTNNLKHKKIYRNLAIGFGAFLALAFIAVVGIDLMFKLGIAHM